MVQGFFHRFFHQFFTEFSIDESDTSTDISTDIFTDFPTKFRFEAPVYNPRTQVEEEVSAGGAQAWEQLVHCLQVTCGYS